MLALLRGPLALWATLLPAALAAEPLCDATPARVAAALSGDWVATVCHGLVQQGEVQLPVPDAPTEPVHLALDASGAGVFTVKSVDVPITLAPSTSDETAAPPGYDRRHIARALTESIHSGPCPLTARPRLSGTKTVDSGVVNRIALTALSETRIVGAQNVTVPQGSGPPLEISTVLDLTRAQD